MRRSAVVAAAVALAAVAILVGLSAFAGKPGESPYRHAQWIDGTWVDATETTCTEPRPGAGYCTALASYAWARSGIDGPVPSAVRFFHAPRELADGSLLACSAGCGQFVVFDLADGRRRLVAVGLVASRDLVPYGYSPAPESDPLESSASPS